MRPLYQLKIKRSECKGLSTQLGRHVISIWSRWTHVLQPWILQHFHGTLTCNIEQMLANHIADNYNDYRNVDWSKVVQKREFAGHTEQSLRRKYINDVLEKASRILNLKRQDMTPIAVANISCQLKKRQETPEHWLRKQNVIEYFERNVNKELIVL